MPPRGRRMAAELQRVIAALVRVRSIMYGDGRTVRTFAGDSANARVPGDRYEMGLKYIAPARFGPLVVGISGRVRSSPAEWELLMPRPILRHIARRAVQGAILAAGILIVLLVFSRQANAATSAPSASVPSAAASAASSVTAAAPRHGSAAAPVTSSAPAPSATSAPAPLLPRRLRPPQLRRLRPRRPRLPTSAPAPSTGCRIGPGVPAPAKSAHDPGAGRVGPGVG